MIQVRYDPSLAHQGAHGHAHTFMPTLYCFMKETFHVHMFMYAYTIFAFRVSFAENSFSETGSHAPQAGQDKLELLVLLPPTHNFWDYRHEWSSLIYGILRIKPRDFCFHGWSQVQFPLLHEDPLLWPQPRISVSSLVCLMLKEHREGRATWSWELQYYLSVVTESWHISMTQRKSPLLTPTPMIISQYSFFAVYYPS